MDRATLGSQGRSPLIKIRRVRKGDLSKVKDVIEQAFADFYERQLGSRPRQVFGGAQYVHHRWLMEPWGCFVAEEGEGKIVGASVAVIWGTVGLVGPIAVLSTYQNQGIGQQLLKATEAFFDENKVALQGLATYPQSPKHLCFYQKHGFKPKGLVAITVKALDRREIVPVKAVGETHRFSELEEVRKKSTMQKLRRLTHAIYRGMDVGKEVEIVDGLALGDTLVLEKGRDLLGFAIYHTPGVSEAPQGSLYVKFLALDPRHRRPECFHQLLATLEEIAHGGALQRVIVPVYTYYWSAYQALLERGYYLDVTMVRMKRGKLEDYEHPGDFILDDWR
ncbi:MAG: GNAT family N-acetyltransferase [Candidatus Rokubacteria bacterium]|nr:GNAT family N-acetyltransferase [Candidatus Rokubacteria bacterium]